MKLSMNRLIVSLELKYFEALTCFIKRFSKSPCLLRYSVIADDVKAVNSMLITGTITAKQKVRQKVPGLYAVCR